MLPDPAMTGWSEVFLQIIPKGQHYCLHMQRFAISYWLRIFLLFNLVDYKIYESSKHFRSFSLIFLEVWRFIPIFANVIYGLTLKTESRMVT